MDYHHQNSGGGGSSGMIILAVVVLLFLLMSSGAGAYYYYYYSNASANNSVTVDVTNVAAAASVSSSGSGNNVCGGSKISLMDLTEFSNLNSNLVSMYCSNISNINVLVGGLGHGDLAAGQNKFNMFSGMMTIDNSNCSPGQQPFTAAMATMNVVPGTYTGVGPPPSIPGTTMVGTCVSNGSTITHTSTFEPYSRR
jgi:hypothetical protein